MDIRITKEQNFNRSKSKHGSLGDGGQEQNIHTLKFPMMPETGTEGKNTYNLIYPCKTGCPDVITYQLKLETSDDLTLKGDKGKGCPNPQLIK